MADTQGRQGRPGDIASGAVLAGLGLYIIVESRRWEYATPDGPGPGMFPMWYGIIMLLLSLALVVSALMRKGAPGQPVNWGEVRSALTAWAAFALCLGLLKVLGFVISFTLFTYFIVSYCYRRPKRTAALTAAGCSLGFYLLFPLAPRRGPETGRKCGSGPLRPV